MAATNLYMRADPDQPLYEIAEPKIEHQAL